MTAAHAPLKGALSFRREPRLTGLAAMTELHPATQIKIGGLQVGTITPPQPRGASDWSITVMVRSPGSRCGWETRRVKRRFASERDARDAFSRDDASIRAKINLHQLD